jgi:hypothetical protein
LQSDVENSAHEGNCQFLGHNPLSIYYRAALYLNRNLDGKLAATG